VQPLSLSLTGAPLTWAPPHGMQTSCAADGTLTHLPAAKWFKMITILMLIMIIIIIKNKHISNNNNGSDNNSDDDNNNNNDKFANGRQGVRIWSIVKWTTHWQEVLVTTVPCLPPLVSLQLSFLTQKGQNYRQKSAAKIERDLGN